MQLDIFADSRQTQLRNALAESLLRQDAVAAAGAHAALAEEFPDDSSLRSAAALIRVLEGEPAPTEFRRHEDAMQAERLIVDEIDPAAQAVLGAAAAAEWLPARWATLAQRSASLPFNAHHEGVHAAPYWLRARDWHAAADAVARIPSWRRIPQPLAWMAHARYGQHGLDAIWDLLAELAWMSARRLDAAMTAISDPLLQRLRERFDATFDDGDDPIAALAWFPAWLLTERPSLAPRLALAERGTSTPAERGMRLLVELLGLERQGRQRDIAALRKELRGLHAALFAAYMATR